VPLIPPLPNSPFLNPARRHPVDPFGKIQEKAMAGTKITTDHDEIRKWAEARGGRPAVVRATHDQGGGIIRIEFPDAPHAQHDALAEISWQEFFAKFDEADLALLYQEETAGGERSNFNKLVGRETAAARERGSGHASRRHPGGR
jgi:hypothetical protein